MITRLSLDDWRTIGHYLGALVLLMAGMMLIPFVIALCLRETDQAVIFLKCMGLSSCIGAVLVLLRINRAHMDRRQALIVTGLSWIVLSFIGTLPLWFSGHYATFLDAFFEGVSGLTATGLSVALDLDHMALSMITWRFILHLSGGIGVLVIALALGIFGAGSGAASVYTAEGRGDHVMPEIKQTSRFIAKVSVTVLAASFIACIIPLLVAGQSPLRAAFSSLWISISAYATGGMVGQSMGIMAYHSWPLEIISILVMFFGVINFLLYGDLWRGIIRNFFKDIEIRTLAIWIVILVVMMMLALSGSDMFTTLASKVRRALYLIISGATNVGFTTTYSGQVMYAMGTGATVIVMISMIMGGSASSTTGGVKAFRFGIIAKTFVHTIREALTPDRVQPRTFFYHMNKRLLTPDLASSALTVFLLFVLTFAIGAIVGIIYGYDALPAVFESVSAATNGGLSSGIVGAGMPVGLEAVYIIEMLLGRLEFIAMFAIILQMLNAFVPHHRLKLKRGDKR